MAAVTPRRPYLHLLRHLAVIQSPTRLLGILHKLSCARQCCPAQHILSGRQRGKDSRRGPTCHGAVAIQDSNATMGRGFRCFVVSLHACSLDMPDKICTSNQVQLKAKDNISSCGVARKSYFYRVQLAITSAVQFTRIAFRGVLSCWKVHGPEAHHRLGHGRLGPPFKICGKSRKWTANETQGIKETFCDGLDHLRMTDERDKREVLSRASQVYIGARSTAATLTVVRAPKHSLK